MDGITSDHISLVISLTLEIIANNCLESLYLFLRIIYNIRWCKKVLGLIPGGPGAFLFACSLHVLANWILGKVVCLCVALRWTGHLPRVNPVRMDICYFIWSSKWQMCVMLR